MQFLGSRIYSTGANYKFNGASAQITGAGLAGANNLTIANTSGVSLSGPVSVSGTLTFTSGLLATTTTNLLSITNTSTGAIIGASATSYIDGPVSWSLPSSLGSGSTYNFPVGNGTTYLPFALVNPTTGTGTVTAQVQATSGNTGGTFDATLASLSTSEYWSLVTTGNFTNSSVSLSRPTAIAPLNAIGGSSSLAGTYTCLDGTAGTTGVAGSGNIGFNNRFFVLAEKKQTITTGIISGSPFCAGNTVSVPFTITGVFNSGNLFTAQLSDAAGNFGSAVNIGSLTQIYAGTITATIPIGTSSGSGYRIRVVSSTPVIIGTDNGSNLTVNAILTAVALSPSTGQTICASGTGTLLTATETGGGTITGRQWGKRSTSGGTITALSGATSSNYTPTGTDLGTGIWYVVCTSTPTCGSANISNEVTVTVDPVSVGGTVSGSTTVCSGTNSTVLTLSGNTGNVTKWQTSSVSDFSSGIIDIVNTTNSLTASNLTTTTYFRAVVTSGVCSSANSTTATITVDPVSFEGTASAASAQVCYNTSTTLTLTGYVGTAIQWEQSANGTSGWANVTGGSGATTSSYTTPNLTIGTWYRAKVTNGVCSSTESNAVSVTIDSELPVFTGCPSNMTVNVDAGLCTKQVDWTIPGVTDNCGIQTLTVTASAGETISTPVAGTHRATIATGTTTITYTATDTKGNVKTCVFTITVTDNIAPTINCPAGSTVFCVANATIYNNFADFTTAGGTATDNCNLNTNSFTHIDNLVGSTLTRTYQISDMAENISTCTQVFTISQPTVTISSLGLTNTCIGGALTITSNSTGKNYQWQVSSNNGGSWSVVGTNSPTYNGSLANQGDQYRMLVSETTDFSGVGCVSTSNVLIFTENTPPVFTLLAPANQTVCTVDGATSVAVYGISLDNSKVTDNCTAFNNLVLTYTISGATTGSGSNLSEGTIFNLGTSTITYTATDQGGNLSTHSITIIVNQSPAAITISHSVVSGGGTGILPNQCGVYNYTVDGGTPAVGYTYSWNVYAGGTATGTPVLTFGNLAAIQITWSGDLAPGTYTIEATKISGANSCNSKSTLQITLQNRFNLFVNDPGNDCKGESLGSKIINWEVGRNCGNASYSFTYVIAAGNYNTLADAQAHAISGMPVIVTGTSDNPKIIYQTVDYGTGGDFYTTQVFTLFIYNQIDGNGQPDINSADDFQHFFLKAIPNTTDISTN